MRKLFNCFMAGAILFGTAAAASATEIKIKGQFNFGFGLYDGTTFTKHAGEENFDVVQRFKTQIDFIASESLKGVLQLEIGDTRWGNGGGATWGGSSAGSGTGGAMGADGVSVEVQHAYLDWLVPNTDLQVRMGLQPWWLPAAVVRADYNTGNFILDEDLAGVLLSYGFNDNIGVNLGWFRPWNPYLGNEDRDLYPWMDHDEIDLFALTVPIEVSKSFLLHPYFMFANVGEVDVMREDPDGGYYSTGRIASSLSGNDALGGDGKAWWAGVAFNLDHFDPFFAAFDFAYGSYTADDVAAQTPISPDRAGWVFDLKFGYKLDYFTPVVFGWYGSGADYDGGDGKDGMMPYLSTFWGMTNFGGPEAHFAEKEYLLMDSPAGSWGIGAGLEDIRFLEDLTSHLRFMYFQGTNDLENYNKAAKAAGRDDAFRAMYMFDKSDWGFEVNLDNVINIYENLDMYVDLAYIHLDVEHHADDFESNAWKGYIGFTYNF